MTDNERMETEDKTKVDLFCIPCMVGYGEKLLDNPCPTCGKKLTIIRDERKDKIK